MHASRRILAGVVVLGLVIALAVFVLGGEDAPVMDDGAAAPIEEPEAARQPAPTFSPAPEPSLPESGSAPVASTTEAGDKPFDECALVYSDAAAFAMMERDAASPDQASRLSEEEIIAELENLSSRLASSPDEDLFLTAFLMDRPEARVSEDPASYTLFLELGNRAANSDSPLLAWHALRACVAAAELCPYAYLQEDLLEAQRDNAEAWALMATVRYRQGDVAGALTAMQEAARASTSTWYWRESVALIERSEAEHTAIPYVDRAMNGFGLMAANLPRQSRLTTMCRMQSDASQVWAQACLGFAALRAEHNEGMAAQAIAYSIREHALRALGKGELAAQVAAESGLFEADRIAENSRARNQLLQALVETGPQRLQAYLSAVQEYGETAGMRMFLRQHLPPLMQRAGLLERDGARECIAQFFEPVAAVVSGPASDPYYEIRIGDQLQITVPGRAAASTTLRVGQDGTITMRRIADIVAVGKTPAQLQSDIAIALSARYRTGDVQVFVNLLSPRSSEELRLEFDTALREAQEKGDP